MSDIINPGNKRDKWTLRVTELLNWLNDNKSAVLTAGDNISLTPKSDGTIEISASGGGEGTVTDVLVDGVSVVNQDGEAEIDLSDKQDKLVAGTNIQIGQDGKTISATDTTYSDFVGATSQQAGTHGLVPAPLVIEKDKFLKGDGTWSEAGGGNVDDVVMNGQSIVDANKVANFNNYVELTQAQYDALPSSKLTDGILYCIKDTGIVEGDQYAPVIYSLEEREIGVWTDGKPLYQKTIPITLSGSSNTVEQAHGISNIDRVISYSGSLYGAGASRFLPQLYYTDINNYIASVYYVNSEIVYVVYGNWLRNNYSAFSVYVTIKYTKTTDVPGSGRWGTDGVPMVHYDGNEKIIGTWFGETLYEKSFEFTNTIVNTGVATDISSLHIKDVIKLEGVWTRYSSTNAELMYPFGHQESNNHKSYLRVDSEGGYGNNGRLLYVITSDGTNRQKIILQYTKTSS